MRRFRQPVPPQSFLSGRELRRLISMLGMLAILWMLVNQAADPNMWKFFANAPEPKRPADTDQLAEEPPPAPSNAPSGVSGDTKSPASPAAPTAATPGADKPAVGKLAAGQAAPTKPPESFAWETVEPEPGVEGPLDADPEERDAAKEQFQAVSDFEQVSAVDMPAYWRLMRWSRSESFGELRKRAQRGGVDVLFTHFAQEPEKHRGELVQLKLHLVRSVSFAAAKNTAGVKRVYEAWGVTDNDSKSNPYVVVFAEKPPELPLGADIDEEATFVGYFLKDMSYEAYNVRRWAPLLIGRLRWRDNPTRALLREQKPDSRYSWPVLGIGLALLAATIGSWVWRLRHPKKRPPLGSEHEDRHAVQQWIERAEQGEGIDDEEPDKGQEIGRRAVAGALDWIDPNRHNESP